MSDGAPTSQLSPAKDFTCSKTFSRNNNRIRHENTHDKDDVLCGQCKYKAKKTTDLEANQSVEHVKRISNLIYDTFFPSMLKLQQHTHNRHELTKSPNSQITHSRFGEDGSLRELVRRKTQFMVIRIVLLPHQTTVNLLREERIDYQNAQKTRIILIQVENRHQATRFLNFSRLCSTLKCPKKDRFYKSYAAFDFEATLTCTKTIESTSQLSDLIGKQYWKRNRKRRQRDSQNWHQPGWLLHQNKNMQFTHQNIPVAAWLNQNVTKRCLTKKTVGWRELQQFDRHICRLSY